jgi:hypothetical protein
LVAGDVEGNDLVVRRQRDPEPLADRVDGHAVGSAGHLHLGDLFDVGAKGEHQDSAARGVGEEGPVPVGDDVVGPALVTTVPRSSSDEASKTLVWRARTPTRATAPSPPAIPGWMGPGTTSTTSSLSTHRDAVGA